MEKLGFGTSGLMGSAVTNKGRIQLLETCFELGIRHFDTAPLYGRGEAEVVLGKFLKNKQVDITITTKFGLPANEIPRYLKPIKPVARFVNRKVIDGRKWLAKRRPKTLDSVGDKNISRSLATEPVAAPKPAIPEASNFDIQSIQIELEKSLRKLQRDTIDFYLFHECASQDISCELIGKLQDLKTAGKINNFGIATGNQTSSEILQKHPEFSGIIQCPYPANTDRSIPDDKQLYIHSIFNNPQFKNAVDAVSKHQGEISNLLEELAIPCSAQAIPSLLLLNQATIRHSPDKLIFSSSKTAHIKQVTDAFACLKQETDINELLNRLPFNNDY